jgi:hypothetical protein
LRTVTYCTENEETPGGANSSVCTTAPISATFVVPSGLEMNPDSISLGTASVLSGIELDFETGTVATFKPVVPLEAGVRYVVTVKGGAAGVKDTAMPPNTMLGDTTWTFTAVECGQFAASDR